MQGLISVIIPVYNVEKYLVRCIDSVISQTYGKLEIILVDDGSTDQSGKMCDEYALRDDRIKVIHKQNGGLADARNAGLKIATGDYIGFVDSDDWIEPDMYERLYALCCENNLDLIAARFCEYIDDKDKDTLFTNDFWVTDGIGLLKINIFGDEKYVVTNSVWDRLYKREILKDIWFPAGRKYEDICFSAEVFLRAERCGYLDAKLYHYTIRNDSIMGQGVKARGTFNDDILADLLPLMKEKADMLYRAGYKVLGDRCTYNYLRECLQCIEKVAWKKDYRTQSKWLLSEYKSNRSWMKDYCCAEKENAGHYEIAIANVSIYLYVLLVRVKRGLRRMLRK